MVFWLSTTGAPLRVVSLLFGSFFLAIFSPYPFFEDTFYGDPLNACLFSIFSIS